MRAGPPRHALIQEIREAGARTRIILDGDVAGAICHENTGVDRCSHRRHPEGVDAACAIKATGGVIQGRLAPTDEAEREKALEAGHDLDRVLTPTAWSPATTASSPAVIPPTGLLRGVRYSKNVVTTRSLVMPFLLAPCVPSRLSTASRLREILTHPRAPKSVIFEEQ